MKIVYTPDHARHRGKGELMDGQYRPCHEVPERADAVLEAARDFGEVVPPQEFGLAPILAVHTEDYVGFLQSAWGDWCAARGLPEAEAPDALPLAWPTRTLRQVAPRHIDGRLSYYSFDAGTPLTGGTWTAVLAAAQAALTARLLAERSGCAFAITRPPGHHAAADLMGGYCYVNNAAIAAQAWADAGAARVAVLDVDYHHGNGTQSIFYRRGDVLTASIHADPADEYPYFLGYADETGEGDGEGAALNLPLPPGTGWTAYDTALQTACDRIGEFGAEALVLSLGFDTHESDPISGFRLRTEDYTRMGESIAALDRPTVLVLEGGYGLEALGASAAAFLTGFLGRH